MEADVLFVSAASVLLFLIIFLSTNLIRRGPLTSYINIHIEPRSKNINNPIFSRALRVPSTVLNRSLLEFLNNLWGLGIK